MQDWQLFKKSLKKFLLLINLYFIPLFATYLMENKKYNKRKMKEVEASSVSVSINTNGGKSRTNHLSGVRTDSSNWKT